MYVYVVVLVVGNQACRFGLFFYRNDNVMFSVEGNHQESWISYWIQVLCGVQSLHELDELVRWNFLRYTMNQEFTTAFPDKWWMTKHYVHCCMREANVWNMPMEEMKWSRSLLAPESGKQDEVLPQDVIVQPSSFATNNSTIFAPPYQDYHVEPLKSVDMFDTVRTNPIHPALLGQNSTSTNNLSAYQALNFV